MKRPTFETAEVVRIEVHDYQSFFKKGPPHLVARLLYFLHLEFIHPVVHEGGSGSSFYIGFFYPEDARRIQNWLLQNGVRQK